MNIDIALAFQIFNYGVDYGQLKCEEERDGEDWADAFNCCLVSRKTAMPSIPIQRRLPRSEKWRESKTKSFNDFKNLLVQIGKEEQQ